MPDSSRSLPCYGPCHCVLHICLPFDVVGLRVCYLRPFVLPHHVPSLISVPAHATAFCLHYATVVVHYLYTVTYAFWVVRYYAYRSPFVVTTLLRLRPTPTTTRCVLTRSRFTCGRSPLTFLVGSDLLRYTTTPPHVLRSFTGCSAVVAFHTPQIHTDYRIRYAHDRYTVYVVPHLVVPARFTLRAFLHYLPRLPHVTLPDVSIPTPHAYVPTRFPRCCSLPRCCCCY